MLCMLLKLVDLVMSTIKDLQATEISKQYSLIDSSISLEHVSLLNSGLGRKEQLRICCKPSFQTSKAMLQNKGAILILVWTFLLISIYFFEVQLFKFELRYDLQLVAIGATLPLAGWLADVYFGRYKVIRFSLCMPTMDWYCTSNCKFCSCRIDCLLPEQ